MIRLSRCLLRGSCRHFRAYPAWMALAVFACFFQSCDRSTDPPNVPLTGCDCVSWDRDSAAIYNGVAWRYIELRKTYSPDQAHYAIATRYSNDPAGTGLRVIRSCTNELEMFIPGQYSCVSWSEDSRRFVTIDVLRKALVLADLDTRGFVERPDIGKILYAIHGIESSDIYLFGSAPDVHGLYLYDTKRDSVSLVWPFSSWDGNILSFDQRADTMLVWLNADVRRVSMNPLRYRNKILINILDPQHSMYRRIEGPSFESSYSYEFGIYSVLNKRTGEILFDAEIGDHRFGILTLDPSTLALTYNSPEMDCPYFEFFPTWNGDDGYNATWFCLRSRKATVFSGKLK
jgi:hypothetical protein